MNTRKFITLALALIFTLALLCANSETSQAQQTIRYSCSNQVYRAFEAEKIEAFEKATGVKVEVYRASSNSCALRLMAGYADVASTAREMYPRSMDYGFYQVGFCKDPVVVIAKKDCGISNLSAEQVRDLFSGRITNWKAIGGADLPVTIIIPDKDTAANKNFRRFFMKHGDIDADFVTRDSTMVIDAVRYFPCGAISFTSGGAAAQYPELTMVTIDGRAPIDEVYPYYQLFYYVTRGVPSGAVQKFIDFNFSAQGKALLEKYGMIPLEKE
jgi:phosphate transport system substrate-binding protein